MSLKKVIGWLQIIINFIILIPLIILFRGIGEFYLYNSDKLSIGTDRVAMVSTASNQILVIGIAIILLINFILRGILDIKSYDK